MRRLVALLWLGAALAGPAAAQTNEYLATLGTAGVSGADNAHFNLPQGIAYDAKNGHILVADSANDRVQVFNAADQSYVASIGQTDNPGSGNGNFMLPTAVAVDAVRNWILVVDTNNVRVQVFDATSFAYVETLGGLGGTSGAGTDFNFPAGIGIDPVHDRIMVADTKNNRIQIFDAGTLGYVATLGDPNGLLGNDNAHLADPLGVSFDTARNRILVADSGNDRIQVFDGSSFAYLASVGEALLNPLADNAHLNQPFGVTYDSGRDQILAADTGNNRVQAFNAGSLAYAGTIGTTDVAGTDFAHFNEPAGVVAAGPSGDLWVTDFANERVQIFANAWPSTLVAAVLPGARSVQQNGSSGLATVFATMLNSAAISLGDCTIGPTDPVDINGEPPPPLSLDFQATDPKTNVPVGTPDTPFTIGADGAQTFVLSFRSPTAAQFSLQTISFFCPGTPSAPILYGVDTVDLLFSSSPVPDIIALSATPSQNGVLTVPQGGSAAFAVATINAGSTGALTVTLDAGLAASLPLTAGICQTNASAQCLAPPAPSIPVSFAPNATGTFSIFISANGAIPFNPGGSRIFVRFLDGNNVSHGSTSVAVTTG